MSTPGHSGHRAWPRDPRSSAARAADIDWSVPASGRIYDALLGGKNNLVVDQDAAAQLERLLPGTMRLARDNRDFLIRAVGHIAKHEQVGQFLDIGTGLPAEGAIHEIARQFIPDARVVYADNDPVAIRHGQALLAGGGDPHTLMVHADLRNPEQLLGDPEVRDLLNLRKPVAVFLVAVTHFLSDEDNPAILAWLCSQLAPGSIVVFSHVTPGTATDADIRAATAIYERSGGVHIRDGDQLASWLGHLELLEPGLVPVAQWRPTLAHDLGLTQLARLPDTQALPIPQLGGLAAVGRA